MDEDFTLLKNMAICFDKKIIDIATHTKLQKKYPDATLFDLKDQILMPGLINSHVHLEFSSNRAELKLGSFVSWLKSVIKSRDQLLAKCGTKCIDEALKYILESGTTTIGAISSFGLDLNMCAISPLNVVYFNEVLGSTPSAVDIIYSDFLQRVQESKKMSSSSFIPAISIHSAYSTHPVLAKKALELAKEEDMVVSTHFMESMSEREWMDKGEGEFKEFFESFLPNSSPMIKPLEYIELFKDIKTLFTHCTKATESEIDAIIEQNGSITHCPRSNRYLGCGRLEIEKLPEFHLATDGLSSNNSLSLWDEMRAALMLHSQAPMQEFSKRLLKSVTLNPAIALGLKKGAIKIGYDSDFILVDIPEGLEDEDDLALSLILGTNRVNTLFINGKKLNRD